jgi:L-asparaginase
MIRWSVLLCLFVAVPAAAQPQPVAEPALPLVRVIATGGTIAGVQDAPGTLGGYRAGTKSVGDIVQSVPELARFAAIETEQFSNVASTEIMPSQWLGLAQRINEELARPELEGVVVTHGTDRLEETAFFLYLTVKSDKPVVVVGAQRPATGISPDGPINLLSAVRTAASKASLGMGVMVVMDDRIISARENRKLYPRTGGFSGGEMGVIGIVGGRGPEFFFKPMRRHGVDTEFDVSEIETLPQVELVFSYPGGEGPRLADATEGLVVATTGFSPSEREAFTEIRKKGVVMAQAFPSGEHVAGGQPGPPPRLGVVGAEAPDPVPASTPAPAAAPTPMPTPVPETTASASPTQNLPPTVAVQHLLPQKARILLMLALTRTKDPREIQRIFNEY